MADGQIGVNTANATPGLFFKTATGALIKTGPVEVSATAPNATPASGGHAGNSVGETWLDTAATPPIFKVWDGSAWQGINNFSNQSFVTTGTIDANSLASLANLMLAFATRGASIGEPGKLLFGVGPAVTGTTPVGIGPHDYYPIDLATGSFM
jgi:hypothetical protein